MVLNRYRKKVDSLLTPLAKAFTRWGANSISLLSLISALIAALLLFLWHDPWALFIAFILVMINGFFDAIDGQVARISGRSSPRGDLVDHVIDRYADFIIVAGISLSAFADVRVGLLALGSIMIASYMGTQSQAVGLKRDYGGILGRAERILLIMLFLLVQFILEKIDAGAFELSSNISLTLLDFLLVFFIIAANITTVQRFFRAWRALS